MPYDYELTWWLLAHINNIQQNLLYDPDDLDMEPGSATIPLSSAWLGWCGGGRWWQWVWPYNHVTYIYDDNYVANGDDPDYVGPRWHAAEPMCGCVWDAGFGCPISPALKADVASSLWWLSDKTWWVLITLWSINTFNLLWLYSYPTFVLIIKVHDCFVCLVSLLLSTFLAAVVDSLNICWGNRHPKYSLDQLSGIRTDFKKIWVLY
jgi:hypothetical protein